MGLTSILRAFANMIAVVGAAMLAPMLLAHVNGEAAAGSYLFGAIVAFLAAAGLFAASAGRRPPSDFRGALVVVLLWWVGAPVFACLPLMHGGVSFADAYFDAVSAITTTGGWIDPAAVLQSQSGTLWRAQLQWLGGLASIAIAAAIFIRPAFIGIDTLLPPFSRGDRASYLRPLRNAVTTFMPIYAIITAIAFFVFVASGAPAFDSAILALSLSASGGFAPHVDGLSGYGDGVVYAAFPFIVLGGANFVLIARLIRGRRDRVRDVESGAYLVIIFAVGWLFWLMAGAGDVDLVFGQIFNAASFLSTNGLIVGEAPPLILLMVTAIIGGAAVSTAGGFKILRWLVIMRRAREELRRLVSPSAVMGGRNVGNELGVWMHFIVFTMILAALTLILSFDNHAFELASAGATAALSNTGPLLYVAEGGAGGYAVYNEPLRWLLLMAMVLGRLEAAVALALLNRAFWRT